MGKKNRKEKTPQLGFVGGLPVYDRMLFDVKQDHILAGVGAAQREYYFLRLHPRNMEILSSAERREEARRLQAVLDADGVEISFLSLDKTEGLEDQRVHYENVLAQYPTYEPINSEILRRINGYEEERSACVERAHYLVLRCRDRSIYERFAHTAAEYLHFHTAERHELIVMLRNHLLRDFSTMALAEWDEEIKLKYEQETAAFAALRRRKQKHEPTPAFEEIRRIETLRQLFPGTIRFDTRYTQQGDRLFRKTIAVRGYPAELITDSVLRSIGSMAGTTLRVYLTPIAISDTVRLLERQINHKLSQAKSARSADDRVRAEVEHRQVEEAYRGQLEQTARMYFATILVEVHAASVEELRDKVEAVKAPLMAHGFLTDDLLAEQREAYLSMLPYGTNLIPMYERNFPTKTIAALYPFTASRKVDANGVPLGTTSAGSPLFFDIFQRDMEVTNGNTFISGSPGQGKSYLLKKILAMQVAKGTACFTLDAEKEYVDLYAQLGGSNQDCAGGRIKINPLEIRRLSDLSIEQENAANWDELNDPDAFKHASAMLQHLSWLRAFHRILFPGLNDAQIATLQILTQRCYEAHGITVDFDPRTADPTAYPTYTTLYRFIEGVFDNFDPAREDCKLFAKNDVRSILLAMASVYEGAESAVFNGVTNVSNASVINFVVAALLNGDEVTRNAALFNTLSYIWGRVVDRREPTIVAIDEVYLFVVPVVMVWLRNFAKRARKYNAAIITATQNLIDLEAPSVLHLSKPILELAMHKFLFYPGDVDRDATKRLLNLTDSELDVINMSRKKHCLYKCGNQKYHLIVGTMDYEADLFGTAGGE